MPPMFEGRPASEFPSQRESDLSQVRQFHASGRRGVVVTRLIRSAKLLYAGPG